MLVVHPSSTCDVCLDPYTWGAAANTPHAIACGHVFCLQCLLSTHPSLCPLCRKPFAPERIKKLHIDRYTADDVGESDETIQVNGFLQRIALVSGENTPEENVADVVSEISRWLAARDQNQGLCRVLKMSVDSLKRSIQRSLENQMMHDAIKQQDAEWERNYRRQEQDVRTSRLVEKNLLEQLEECKSKLAHAERSLEANNSEMDRLYAEHAQLQAEVANYQNRTIGSHSVSAAGRPTTSLSRRTQLSATTSSTGSSASTASLTRANSEPLGAVGFITSIEEDPDRVERTMAKVKESRSPVLVPGAPASMKVVPSASDPRPVRSDRHSPTITGTQDPFYDDGASSESDEVTSRRVDVPIISAPHYGYRPGFGYVPMAPQSQSAVHVPAGDSSGQLVLYDPERTMADGPAEASPVAVEPDLPPWGHPPSDFMRNPNRSSSSVSTMSSNVRSDRASHSASGSLSSLGLLVDPPSAVRPNAQQAARQNASSPEPSIASWGTVPTAHTSRSASIRDLQLTGLPASVTDLDLSSSHSSSGNSSFANLRLTRLPGTSTSNSSVYEARDDGSDVASVISRSSAMEANVIPPRPEEGFFPAANSGRRLEHDMRQNSDSLDEVLTPRVRHNPTIPISIGLSLSTSSSSSRHHISGADDLYAVNQSLTRTTSESGATTRHPHFRVAFMPDAEPNSRSRSRSRGGQARRPDSVSINGYSSSRYQEDGGRTMRDYPSTSRGTSHAPHTDRISGPLRLPGTVQRSESHGDYNLQRGHSTLTDPYLTTGLSENEIPDRHRRVTRETALNGQDHAYAGPRTQPENRPASIYSPSGTSFATHSHTSLGNASSLGLHVAPPSGPGASVATTSSGEPSMIRAPRPVNGSQSSNIFAVWNGKGSR